jgi:hypothetical protein
MYETILSIAIEADDPLTLDSVSSSLMNAMVFPWVRIRSSIYGSETRAAKRGAEAPLSYY